MKIGNFKDVRWGLIAKTTAAFLIGILMGIGLTLNVVNMKLAEKGM